MGEKKVTRELDVVKLMAALRDIKMIKEVVLSPIEIMLLKYQKARII